MDSCADVYMDWDAKVPAMWYKGSGSLDSGNPLPEDFSLGFWGKVTWEPAAGAKCTFPLTGPGHRFPTFSVHSTSDCGMLGDCPCPAYNISITSKPEMATLVLKFKPVQVTAVMPGNKNDSWEVYMPYLVPNPEYDHATAAQGAKKTTKQKKKEAPADTAKQATEELSDSQVAVEQALVEAETAGGQTASQAAGSRFTVPLTRCLTSATQCSPFAFQALLLALLVVTCNRDVI
jgi:hypothetical protein